MTAMSSAISATTPRSWVMITIAIPSSRCRRSSSARICACTVTSSAVVGSSAISSLGSLASAIAIIARWRMPPENSCGYSSTRRAGSGMPTSPSSSIARARACALETSLVGAHRLDQLLADLVERVQRGQRVLEDHRDLVAADRAQLAPRGASTRSVPSNRIRPEMLRALAARQAERRQRGDGLARARLADDPERAPARAPRR